MGRTMLNLEKCPTRSLAELFSYTDEARDQDMFIHVLSFPTEDYTNFTNSFNAKTLFNIKQKVIRFNG